MSNNLLAKVLSLLRVRSKIGGLEISDTDLRFAYMDGNSLETAALRIPPGIIEGGEIRNYDMMVEALKNLHGLLPPDLARKKFVNVIVTLNSIHIYTQVFSLPLIEESNMKEAIQLNISMVSPFDLSQAYAGWQLISQNRNELKVEILSAFAQKTFIDQLRSALAEAGFFALAVESGALSLARLIREKGSDFKIDKPLLVLSVDDKGLRFLIIRIGQLHFEYFQAWKDIQGEGKEISWDIFSDAIKRSMHQVINFYDSHWQEPLTDVAIASNSYVEEISKLVSENFSLNAKELKLNLDQTLRREWYEVAGSAIRGGIPRTDDKDVNLFGITVQEEFQQQQVIEFLKFWQILVPASLSLLLASMLASYMFLNGISESLEEQASLSINPQQMGEISALAAQIKDFNNSVVMISGLERTIKPKTTIFNEITPMINRNSIVLDRLYLQSEGSPIIFSGETDSQDQILSFKNDLTKDDFFSGVNLNLSDVKPQTKGFSFTLSFSVK